MVNWFSADVSSSHFRSISWPVGRALASGEIFRAMRWRHAELCGDAATTVVARLAASAKASAGLTARAPSKPWRRRDRATQYAVAHRFSRRRLWNTGCPAFAEHDSGEDMKQHSRGTICPGCASSLSPERNGGAGNAGRRCTRGLVCSKAQENAHELVTGTTEHVRHSP